MDFIFPVAKYLTITQGYHANHVGNDYGWTSKVAGGNNQPIIAAEAGTVTTAVDGWGNTNGQEGRPYKRVYGNYVIVSHGNGWHTLYGHLANGIAVKKGQVVPKGQVLGYMGDTGYSFGQHLHFELRKGGNSKAYAVDPLNYVMLEDRSIIVSSTTDFPDRIKYRQTSIGTPVARNTAVDQIEVLIDNMNGRDNASINADRLGYVTKGIYNIHAEQKGGDYTWYQIEVNPALWVAYSSAWEKLYLVDGDAPKKVLDLSEFNTVTDWGSVKASGVEGVILRAGFRGYGSAGNMKPDALFESHYNGATSVGIPVGVYFFTQAKNAAEGQAEAKYVLELIKGKKLDYPIYIDTEMANNGSGRADAISKADRTAAVKGFCDAIVAAGYKAGVYASISWFNNQLDMEQLKENELWVAHYTTADHPEYKETFGMWQYTSSGSVKGINGNVDMNHCYKSYQGNNPEEKPTVTSYDVDFNAVSIGDMNTLVKLGNDLQLNYTVTENTK